MTECSQSQSMIQSSVDPVRVRPEPEQEEQDQGPHFFFFLTLEEFQEKEESNSMILAELGSDYDYLIT
jgi:hypothetical protein